VKVRLCDAGQLVDQIEGSEEIRALMAKYSKTMSGRGEERKFYTAYPFLPNIF
jgi:hypothetical protein